MGCTSFPQEPQPKSLRPKGATQHSILFGIGNPVGVMIRFTFIPGVALRSTPGYLRSPLRGRQIAIASLAAPTAIAFFAAPIAIAFFAVPTAITFFAVPTAITFFAAPIAIGFFAAPTGSQKVARGGAKRNPWNHRRKCPRPRRGYPAGSIPNIPFVPHDPMRSKEFEILLLKRFRSVVLLLTFDVSANGRHTVMANREYAIPRLPRKTGHFSKSVMNPSRRRGFCCPDEIGKCGVSANTSQQMNVIGHTADDQRFATNLTERATEVLIDSRGDIRFQKGLSVFRGKDEMEMNSCKRLWHGTPMWNR